MTRPTKRLTVRIALAVAVSLLVALFVSPVVEVFQIARVKQQFALDDAVHRELINDALHKPTASYALNPPFMARYGLDADEYLDAAGYFAPDGSDWLHWPIRTKAAAIVMWRGGQDLSLWQIRRTIKLVDDYYARNEPTVPVVTVVSATGKL